MEDMSLIRDLESDQTSYKVRKGDKKPTGDDPLADWMMKHYYRLHHDRMSGVRIGFIAVPFIMIFLFVMLISSSTSNVIAFSALTISLAFIAISFWLLCWILDIDPGTREMKDISDAIKEGSEGFFLT